MKKKIIFLSILAIFIAGSMFRFVALNKDIDNKVISKGIETGEEFNINGITFKLDEFFVEDNIEEDESADLVVLLSLFKESNSDIDKNIFYESFPELYPDMIFINIMGAKNKVIGNYYSDLGRYKEENKKFVEIQEGKRLIGKERESLKLRFNLSKEVVDKIRDRDYYLKLVFPTDSSGRKFNFINLAIE